MKKVKEITVAETADYRVYTEPRDHRYFIEYADHNPMNPIPWYATLKDAKEALYYAGFLPFKNAELG